MALMRWNCGRRRRCKDTKTRCHFFVNKIMVMNECVPDRSNVLLQKSCSPPSRPFLIHWSAWQEYQTAHVITHLTDHVNFDLFSLFIFLFWLLIISTILALLTILPSTLFPPLYKEMSPTTIVFPESIWSQRLSKRIPEVFQASRLYT